MGQPLVSMAQQFSGMPMEALIGGPLMSAAQANSQMAMTQVEFLMTTCFTEAIDPTTNENAFHPVMISMVLKSGVITPGTPEVKGVTAEDASGTPGEPSYKPAVAEVTQVDAVPTSIQEVSTIFELPILTVVPLNSLAVDSVDVKFEMAVKSSSSTDNSSQTASKTHAGGKFTGSGGFGPFKVSISGSVSHDSSSRSKQDSHYSSSNSAKYTVSVHAGQLPLPKGVTTIIDAYAKNVSPIMVPPTTKTNQPT
jgi:hypothetical protein